MVAAEGVVESLQAVFWRRQSVSLVAINCEPGQVRKEAAVTSPAWVVVQPLTRFLHKALKFIKCPALKGLGPFAVTVTMTKRM